MCIGGTPSAPAPPPALPEAPRTPDTTTSGVSTDLDARRRAAASGGANSTILTGSRGLSGSSGSTAKTLLGE
jgi:hypothetical protein